MAPHNVLDPKEQIEGLVKSRSSFVTHLMKLIYVLGILSLQQGSYLLSFQLTYADRVQKESLLAYHSSIPFMLILTLVLIDFYGMTHFYRKSGTDMLVASFKVSALTTLLVTFYAFFFHYYEFPRFVIALASILIFVFLTLWSVLFLRISCLIYPKGHMLIVARDEEDAQNLYAKARRETKRMHLQYVGWVADDDFVLVSHKMRTASDILVSMHVSDERKTQILLFCAEKRKTVYIVPQFYELSYTSFRIIQFYDTPTFMIDNMGLTFQQRLFKRTFDIIFSILAIIITLPLQIIIPFLIKLDSKGPVFYTQERNTINSRIYDVLKYRTMVHNAEHLFGAYQAQEDDPRLTRVGRFLRNTHLDELPQFFNVLRGDMSVVGPRSDRPITINEFEQRIPGYDQRLKVKSGITGLAQIMGKYNTDPEDKLRYDMIYIKNYSLLMDLKIVFLTLGAFLPKNQYNQEKTTSDYLVRLEDDDSVINDSRSS